MVVYLFSSWAMNAVGNAAQEIIKEVNKQFAERPGIMTYEETPDYQHCVAIVTRAALREMIKPALLIILSPIALGLTFRFIGANRDDILGARALGAMLMVATMTGVLVGLFLNNAGGAWDNAKKFIEMGNYGGKGSDAHKEQMLKDAVEAYIVKSYNPCTENSKPSLHGIELLYEDKNKPYLLAGDKVRIVVLKEEE